jgi:hypothetical protein
MNIALAKAAIVSAAVIGLVALAAAHPALDAPWALLFDAVKWPIDGAQGAFSSEARLLNAIGGGMLAGWCVVLYWLVSGPIARGERGARSAYAASVGAWFCLDSLGSILAGWPENIVLNLAFLALFAAPFAFGRKSAPA